MISTRTKLEAEVKKQIVSCPDAKLKVSSVAKAVGVSHSTIYNRYPDINEAIKTHNLSVAVAKDETSNIKLKKIKADKKVLLEENKSLKGDNIMLVSINARYQLDNSDLQKKITILEKENAELKSKYGKFELINREN